MNWISTDDRLPEEQPGETRMSEQSNIDKLAIIGPKRTVPQAEYIIQLEERVAELQAVVDRLQTGIYKLAWPVPENPGQEKLKKEARSLFEYAVKHATEKPE